MATPTQTPNRATTTKPSRSSKRVAHKSPLGWLPWLLLLLLALLIAGIVLALVAANSSNSDNSTSHQSTTAASGTSVLAAASAGALVGGGGTPPASATDSGSAAALSGARQSGTAGTVLFAEGSAALDGDAQKVISQAATNLRKAGAKSVEIIGYTDVLAGQPVNNSLSQQRADAVAMVLRGQLPGVTVTTSARGETDPIASNDSAAGRQQNRRVAIVARG